MVAGLWAAVNCVFRRSSPIVGRTRAPRSATNSWCGTTGASR